MMTFLARVVLNGVPGDIPKIGCREFGWYRGELSAFVPRLDEGAIDFWPEEIWLLSRRQAALG